MKNFFFLTLLLPIVALAAIEDWSYVPYIRYNGQSPDEVIRQGRNFELLQTLWAKPQTLENLREAGCNFSDVDINLLMRQGMVYRDKDVCYSAIPFIDSIAMNDLRKQANVIAKNIIEDTRDERESFLLTLDNTGYGASAFALAHSLVFDDIIWEHINVSMENATISHTDSMTWSGVFYFFRPEETAVYGTNGIKLGQDKSLKFAWGDASNAYLCTAFITTNILKALKCLMNGQELSDEMLRDCKKYGILDENDRLTVPVLDGKDAISLSADTWANAAAGSFMKQFQASNLTETIGLSPDCEAAAKVILYHEVLFQIDKILDETGLLPIPEVLTSKHPADVTRTASVAYITTIP